jgi:hypothetical protein
MAAPIIANFNAGEWSPALFGRVDLEKYYSACEILENFICRPHGPAVKRPGTVFVWESLGRNELTNGTFAADSDWTLGTGYTIAGGLLCAATGAGSNAYQDITVLKTGKYYDVVFTLSDYAGGSVRPYINNSYGAWTYVNGAYHNKIQCLATAAFSFGFAKTDDFEGKIDNVELREIAPVTKLLTFNFSTEQNYVLAFTEKNIRFFKDGGIILNGDDLPYEVATPYLDGDLFELDHTQSADTFYIAHADHRPQKLERFAHDDWLLSDMSFQCWPGKNIMGARKIYKTDTEKDIELDIPGHGFVSGDNVAIWGVEGMVEINGLRSVFNAKDDTCRLRNMNGHSYGDYTGGGEIIRVALITGATQENPVKVTAPNHRWANGDKIRIERVQGMTELNDHNFIVSGKTPDGFFLEDTDGTGYGAYTTAGDCHSRGEDFSAADHHPSCVEFFEERLFWANSKVKPQTLWGSVVGDYQNNRLGAIDDDAIEYTIAAKGVNPILWLVPQDKLLMGTVGAEWCIGSSTPDEPLTMYSVQAKRQSTYGSKKVIALLVNDIVLFVQRAGTKIRELTYSFEKDGYVAPDLTILAEHVIRGVNNIAYQQEPTNILWCISQDGTLACMVYERSQSVVGWSRIITDGNFKSVTVIPTPDTEDCVWVVVERTVEGVARHFVEYLASWEWSTEYLSEKCFFVDSGLSYDGGARQDITDITLADPAIVFVQNHGYAADKWIKIEGVEGCIEPNGTSYQIKNPSTHYFSLYDTDGNAVDATEWTEYISGGTTKEVVTSFGSGLEHLEGKQCTILADGFVMPPQTVNAGGIQVGGYANQIHIGLPYTAKLKPMNLEAGQSEGTAQGKTKRIHSLKIRFMRTMGCKVGTCEDDLEEIQFRQDSDPLDIAIPPFTGDKEMAAFPGSYESNGSILIVSETPLPITIVALMPKLRVYDGYR